MKVRLRADLGVALKERRIGEVRLIRTLVAAIENAEAPPLHAGRKAADQHSFRDGTAEIERRVLDSAMVRSALMAEIQEREHAAAELERFKERIAPTRCARMP